MDVDIGIVNQVIQDAMQRPTVRDIAGWVVRVLQDVQRHGWDWTITQWQISLPTDYLAAATQWGMMVSDTESLSAEHPSPLTNPERSTEETPVYDTVDEQPQIPDAETNGLSTAIQEPSLTPWEQILEAMRFRMVRSVFDQIRRAAEGYLHPETNTLVVRVSNTTVKRLIEDDAMSMLRRAAQECVLAQRVQVMLR